MDLFAAHEGARTFLWAGAGFFVHPGVGDHGVWHQQYLTYSNTRGGLARQLQLHYFHRLDTAEVYGISQDEMRDELKLAMFHLSLPASLVDTDKPDTASYNWKRGESYAQFRHLDGWTRRTLHVAGLEQEMREYENAQPDDWRYERLEALRAAAMKITKPVGEVLGMDLFKPPAIRPEEEEKHVACFHCSI